MQGLLNRHELARAITRRAEIKKSLEDMIGQHEVIGRHKNSYWFVEALAGDKEYIQETYYRLAHSIELEEEALREVEDQLAAHYAARQAIFEGQELKVQYGSGKDVGQMSLF